MKHIELNIGKACNNKCRFCMSSKNYIDSTTESIVGDGEKYGLAKYIDVKNEIISYANKGYESIGFLGGDISIHPYIYEIIKDAKINGFKKLSVITNGMIFSDFEKAEKLVSSGANLVNISVHSHLNTVEDYLTQVPGGLIKKLKAIDNFNLLYNKGLLKSRLTINIVLNKLNYKEILKTCIFFNKVKKIDNIRINFLWNRFFFSENDKNELELSYTEFIPYLRELVVFSLKKDLSIKFETVPACIFNKLGFKDIGYIVKRFVGENYDHIDEVSNINKGQIFNWKEQKEFELKNKFENCNICLFNIGCHGIWKEYIDKYGNKEFIEVS